MCVFWEWGASHNRNIKYLSEILISDEVILEQWLRSDTIEVKSHDYR